MTTVIPRNKNDPGFEHQRVVRPKETTINEGDESTLLPSLDSPFQAPFTFMVRSRAGRQILSAAASAIRLFAPAIYRFDHFFRNKVDGFPTRVNYPVLAEAQSR
jgi:hypothetical protein